MLKLSWRKYSTELLVAGAATWGMLTTGMHMGWISQANKVLSSEDSPVHLANNDTGTLSTLLFLGSIPGAIVAFILSQVWSQRKCFLIASILQATAFLIYAFVPHKLAYFSARFIAGLSGGSMFTILPGYGSEIASTEIRGLVGVLIMGTLILGNLIPVLIFPFVDFQLCNAMFVVVPIIHFICCLFIPESPYFLLRKQDSHQAKDVLNRLRKTDKVDKEFEDISVYVENLRKDKVRLTTFVTDIVYRKAILFSTIGIVCQQSSGMTSYQSYITKILASTEEFISSDTGTIIALGLGSLCSMLALFFVDKFGRKFLFITSSLLMAIFSTILAVYFYFYNSNTENVGMFKFVPILCMCILFGSFSIGVGSIPYLYTSEIMPSNVRALGGCYLTLVGAVTGALLGYSYIPLQNVAGEHAPMAVYAIGSIISTILVVIYLPETKGKTFPEIERMLRYGKSGEKSEETGVK